MTSVCLGIENGRSGYSFVTKILKIETGIYTVGFSTSDELTVTIVLQPRRIFASPDNSIFMRLIKMVVVDSNRFISLASHKRHKTRFTNIKQMQNRMKSASKLQICEYIRASNGLGHYLGIPIKHSTPTISRYIRAKRAAPPYRETLRTIQQMHLQCVIQIAQDLFNGFIRFHSITTITWNRLPIQPDRNNYNSLCSQYTCTDLVTF